MRTYWDVTAWQTYDVVIVGGGIIGISTAISCAERMPTCRIVVVERGHLPYGATTRNAGFACFGSISEIAHDIDIMGADAAHALVQRRWLGLKVLQQRCGRDDVQYRTDGGSEVFLSDHPALERIGDVNALLRDVIGEDPFHNRLDLRDTYGLSKKIHALIHTPHESTLHSGRMLRTLWRRAVELGVEIRTGSEVVSIDAHDSAVTLQCVGPHQTVDLTCSNVVVATNAMIPSLLESPSLPEIKPGRGQVLVTAPVPGLLLRGSFHFDEGYYYFRELDGRVLLGGGRNLDFEGETTTSLEITDRIQNALEELLRSVVLPTHTGVAIEYRWAGTMAFTDSKQPAVAFAMPRVLAAFGCNGMGVAIGSSIGEECAKLLAST
jgi:glycine/D-amino acid oxidase-like deaminating enzyme